MSAPYAPRATESTGSRATDSFGPPTIGHPSVPATSTTPMYWRVLRLVAVRPNGWQRALLVEGVIAVAVILALADVASAWVVIVLPLVAAGVVKAHDYLVQVLPPHEPPHPPRTRH